MLRKSSLVIAMMAMVSVGSVAAAAPMSANGVVRNQIALGVAGRTTPYMRAMAQQCGATASQATCGVAGQSNLTGGGSSFIILIAAIGAGGLGLYEALHHHHHHQTVVSPVSS